MKKQQQGNYATRWRVVPKIQTSFFLLLFFIQFSSILFAQPGPSLKWEKTIGKKADERFTSWVETADGFLFSGFTGKGAQTYFVLKTDKQGSTIWTKNLGTTSEGLLIKIFPAEDGKYLLVGEKNVTKISADGNVVWNNNKSGGVTAVRAEGGYLIGKTTSVSIINQNKKYIVPAYSVIKIDYNGQVIWEKSYRGGAYKSFYRSEETLGKLVATKDGGFLLTGTSNSFSGNDKTSDAYGEGDVWMVKVDSKGAKVWDKTFGGTKMESFNDLVEAPDGGYLILAQSSSDVSGNKSVANSMSRTWLVKVSSDGEKEWDKITADHDVNYSMITATSSGFYLTNDQYQKQISKFNWEGNRVYRDNLNKNEFHETLFFGITSDGGFITGNYSLGNRPGTTINKYNPENPSVATTLYRAINLNSNSALKIDNIAFEGSRNASNFTAIGENFENQDLEFSENLSEGKTKMLRSAIMGTNQNPAAFTFQGVPSGYYEVYLYVINDNESTEEFSISVKGKQVLNNLKLEDEESWVKLGPFKTVVGNGVLDVQTSGGVVKVSGIELRKEEPECERALNLNSGESLVIDNKKFEAGKSASGFAFQGEVMEDQTITLNPPTDPNRAKMIRSSIYSTKTSPGVLNIDTKLNGYYDVYLYIWEDNYPSRFTLNINGADVDHPVAGNKGSWKKIGPYRVYVENKLITIKSSFGEGNISGVEIYKVGRETNSSFSEGDRNIGTKIIAFPNPLGDVLTIQFDKPMKEVVKVSLFDSFGKNYVTVNKILNNDEQFDIHIPSNLPSGIYLLKVKVKEAEQIIRVNKK